ncbi:MAG: glycosyltransferase family 2 protein [Gammaproteobacteria bacterium]
MTRLSDPSAGRPSDDPGWTIEVSAVIPCLNEAETIGICVEKALASFASLGVRGEVVVVDNGSIDESVRIAETSGARVLREPRKGYGAALARGISEAKGEIVVMADGDDSYDWSAIAPFISKIREGHDLVIGNRFRGGIMPGAMPPLHRYLGNPALSWMARIAFRIDIGDFHCGMRAVTRTAFARLGLTSRGMEFATEMVANAACLGLDIAEIPTKLYPDKRGRPPHLRSFRDGWRHLRFILTYAPDYVYLAPGLALLAAGLLLQALLVRGPVVLGGFYVGIHFLALGSMLTLVGFNVLNLGVLAKTLMAQRYSGLRSLIVDWARHRFRLEWGLIAGAALVLAGLLVDIAITIEWLRSSGPMERTVHVAFVATSALVLGLNLMFTAFLLHMILLVSSESRWVGSP